MLDLSSVSTWSLAAVAAVGWAVAEVVLYRLVPRRTRTRTFVVSAVMFATIAAQAATGHRAFLWALILIAVAIDVSLVFYPRLPEDLPPPGDPRRRAHPRYAELQRRGRFSAVLLVVLLTCGIAASAALVHLGP